MSRFSWAVAVLALVGLLSASPAVVQAQSWKGLYAGVNLGATWGTFRDPVTIGAVSTFPATTQSFEVSTTSFDGGAQVGYGWQRGHWVFGPAADFDLRNLNGTEAVTTNANNFVSGDNFSAASHIGVAVVGQGGYARGAWLFYGAAGPASAGTKVIANFVAIGEFPAASGSGTAMLVGGTVRAGVARKILKDHWIAGAEYRYSLYGRSAFSTGTLDSYINPSGGFFASQTSASVGLQHSEFVVKLNYKF